MLGGTGGREILPDQAPALVPLSRTLGAEFETRVLTRQYPNGCHFIVHVPVPGLVVDLVVDFLTSLETRRRGDVRA